jgi:hypothetical protein
MLDRSPATGALLRARKSARSAENLAQTGQIIANRHQRCLTAEI